MKFKSILSRFLSFGMSFVLAAQIAVLVAFFLLPQEQRVMSLIGISIAGASAVALVFIFLAKDINKTLRPLINSMQDMDKGRKVSAIKHKRVDELGELIDTFNQMVDRDKAMEQANTDALTGLGNRRYFIDQLKDKLSKKQPLTVMFIDLDGFKPVNDTYGHDAGDEALKMVADRLNACVRESDVVARLGGDEFVVMLTNLTNRDIIKQRGDKILEMLSTPYWIGDNRIKMGGSIGISISPDDGTDADNVLNAADEAMYAAKQGGKNAYRFYS